MTTCPKLTDIAITSIASPSSLSHRMERKIARDSFYRETFHYYKSLSAVVQAGFFDDRLDSRVLEKCQNPYWLTTPLTKLRNALQQLSKRDLEKKPLVVLLTTGCFSPVHEGHLAMMKKAREKLIEEGFCVLGGYFSPSHDHYATTKKNAGHFHASLRIQLLNQALQENHWLMVDPWEALFTPTAINFTDVIRRLKAYLNTHLELKQPIEVAYVFGGDNAYFSRAFVKEGISVCVNRLGYEKLWLEAQSEALSYPNKRLFFVGNRVNHTSSEQIRRSYHFSTSNKKKEKPPLYLVRNDLAWATAKWKAICQQNELARAVKEFSEGLKQALQNTFFSSHDQKDMEILFLSAAKQQEWVDAISQSQPIINLDIVTQKRENPIGFSRLFSLSDPQFRSHQLIARPESNNFRHPNLAGKAEDFIMIPRCRDRRRGNSAEPIAEEPSAADWCQYEILCPPARSGCLNLDAIPKYLPASECWMIDDDIATGETMSNVASFLPKDVAVTKKVSLSEVAFKEECPDSPYAFWDIVDARDFLFGAQASGLVVRLFNGKIARTPYIYPFISLANRAKLPPEQEMSFSREIIALNKQFFEKVNIFLNDADRFFQFFAKSAGLKENLQMTEVCDFFYEMLASHTQTQG